MNLVRCELSTAFKKERQTTSDRSFFADLDRGTKFEAAKVVDKGSMSGRYKAMFLILTEKGNWVLAEEERVADHTGARVSGNYKLFTKTEAALWVIANTPKKIPYELKTEVEALVF